MSYILQQLRSHALTYSLGVMYRNQPFVEQAGSTALFPANMSDSRLGINNRNFLVGAGTSRYVVIGGDFALHAPQRQLHNLLTKFDHVCTPLFLDDNAHNACAGQAPENSCCAISAKASCTLGVTIACTPAVDAMEESVLSCGSSGRLQSERQGC